MKLLAAMLMMSSLNAFALVKIENRLANDYSLFDDITGYEVIEKTVTPSLSGSRLVIKIKGDISSRDCSYDSHVLTLQPRTAPRAQDEVYLASLIPLYQQKTLQLSFIPCTDIVMMPVPFETNLEFVSHGWHPAWGTRVYDVTFLGISGITVKRLTAELSPKGWNVQLK